MKRNGKLPYLMAGVRGLELAIPAEYVQEIILRPQWHAVPRLPPYCRGVINLRGQVIPLIDLRLRLDLPSSLTETEEMIAMFLAREQDHIRWLKELQNAIREKRPFTLARDPTQCAFGKWYYSYKPDDIGFASVMYRFEEPHRRIHNLADIALSFAAQGNFNKAEELIEHTRAGDLKTVIQLFQEVREAFAQSKKELAVVLHNGEKHLSITVDRVAAVESIHEDSVEDAAAVMGSIGTDLFDQIARRENGKGTVFLMDVEKLFVSDR